MGIVILCLYVRVRYLAVVFEVAVRGMSDQKEKLEALSEELVVVQRRVEHLEGERVAYLAREKESAQIEHKLGERVKELNCLYGIARLVDQCGSSPDALLQGVVDLVPGSWQYPEITCGRIVLEECEYITSNFQMAPWKQTAAIRVGGRESGVVEVYYLNEMCVIDEGPFLKEERLLIDAIAERLGRVIERMRAEQQLVVERQALENANVALRQVLARVQEEKEEVKKAMQANVDKVVMPILHALENDVPEDQRGYVTLLRRNLEEIASPFADSLAKTFMSLTPTEIQICSMIRRGLTSKEIAMLRGVSPATVNRHREHIRRKLKITNEDVNLVTYLSSVGEGTLVRGEG